MTWLLEWDREVFLYLHHLGSVRFDAFWIFVTGTTSWLPFYVLLLYFRFRFHRRHFPDHFLRRFCLEFLLMVVVVGACDWISVHGFKEVFQRLRPTHHPDLIEAIRAITGRGGRYGFVSSHAANTFGLAMLMYLLSARRSFGLLMFVWAGFVSYSRIYVGKHYPLDLLGGAALGCAIAGVFYGIYALLLKRFNA